MARVVELGEGKLGEAVVFFLFDPKKATQTTESFQDSTLPPIKQVMEPPLQALLILGFSS